MRGDIVVLEKDFNTRFIKGSIGVVVNSNDQFIGIQIGLSTIYMTKNSIREADQYEVRAYYARIMHIDQMKNPYFKQDSYYRNEETGVFFMCTDSGFHSTDESKVLGTGVGRHSFIINDYICTQKDAFAWVEITKEYFQKLMIPELKKHFEDEYVRDRFDEKYYKFNDLYNLRFDGEDFLGDYEKFGEDYEIAYFFNINKGFVKKEKDSEDLKDCELKEESVEEDLKDCKLKEESVEEGFIIGCWYTRPNHKDSLAFLVTDIDNKESNIIGLGPESDWKFTSWCSKSEIKDFVLMDYNDIIDLYKEEMINRYTYQEFKPIHSNYIIPNIDYFTTFRYYKGVFYGIKDYEEHIIVMDNIWAQIHTKESPAEREDIPEDIPDLTYKDINLSYEVPERGIIIKNETNHDLPMIDIKRR